MSATDLSGSLRERQLREQLEALECALDHMGDGIVVLDRNGRLLLSNPAARRMVDQDLHASQP